MPSIVKWDEVVDRYPVISTLGGSSKAYTTHIIYAEAELNGLLAGFFAMPLLANNLTAKDCIIDLVYLRMGTLKIKEAAYLREKVHMKIKKLRMGDAVMMLDDGTSLTGVGSAAYSDDENYDHTYSIGDELTQEVDHQKLTDEKRL